MSTTRHGLKSSKDFLNAQISKESGRSATFSFEPFEHGVTEHNSLHCLFKPHNEDREVTLRCWSQPKEVEFRLFSEDWKSASAQLWPSILKSVSYNGNEVVFVVRNVNFLEDKTFYCVIPLIHRMTDGRELGLFRHDSPVVKEFKRRFTIEASDKREQLAKASVEKQLALGPFVED